MIFILTFQSEEEERKYHSLYWKHSKALYRIALRILRDEGLAGDAVQECFLKVFLHMKDIEKVGPEKEAAYITQILKYTAYNLYKQKKRHTVVTKQEEDELAYIEDDFSVDEILAKAELTDMLLQEIKRLDELDRSIVFYRFFYDKGFREIGELLDMNETAVRVRLFRIKKRLAEKLTEKKGGGL